MGAVRGDIGAKEWMNVFPVDGVEGPVGATRLLYHIIRARRAARKGNLLERR